MADHKSALKRIRQTETVTARKKDRLSRMKTMIKKFLSIREKTDATPVEKQEAFRVMQSEVAAGVTKNILHKNTAARKISRLHKMLKASCN